MLSSKLFISLLIHSVSRMISVVSVVKNLLYNTQAQFDMSDDGNDITEILCRLIRSGIDAFDDINPAFETSYQKRPIIKGKGFVHTNKLCYGFDALYTVCHKQVEIVLEKIYSDA